MFPGDKGSKSQGLCVPKFQARLSQLNKLPWGSGFTLWQPCPLAGNQMPTQSLARLRKNEPTDTN